MLEFRLLGPVEVLADGRPLDLGPPKRLAVLAALLVDAGRPVSVTTLVDRVWGDDPPAAVRATLYSHITRVRALIAAGGTSVELGRGPGGYVLRVDPDAVDLFRSQRLADQARHSSASPAERAVMLQESLDLWRGEPLSGVAGAWADHLRQLLAERRIATLTLWAELELGLGRHDVVVEKAGALLADHPLAEPVIAVLMRALFLSGRAAEALARYATARRRFAEDLGTEPGHELQRLHEAILRGSLESGPPRQTQVPVVPAQLPLDVFGFAGRENELARLEQVASASDAQPSAVVICVLFGPAGVGKSALAVHWAHRVASRFPDGQLHVNLRGFDPAGTATPPAEAIRGFLDAFEVPSHRIPAGQQAQVNLYRTLMAKKRALVVLDNARDAEQVRPLLPGAPGCMVLVTSRDRLTGLAAAEGARPLGLDLLTDAEAKLLLSRRVDAGRMAEPAAVQEIVVRCARLPLALAIVGARLTTRPELSLRTLLTELRQAKNALAPFSGDDAATDIRAVFSWSYVTLSSPAADLFRLLGLCPGPDISRPAAASLAGVSAPEAESLLAELATAHLLDARTPGRYSFHDLLRAYAGELTDKVDDDDRRHAATLRMLSHYLHTAYACDRLLSPRRDLGTIPPAQHGTTPETVTEYDAALEWFSAERPVLLACIRYAATTGYYNHAIHLAWATMTFFDRRGLWHDWIATQHTALACAQRINSPVGQGNAHRALGRAYVYVDRPSEAKPHLEAALAKYGEAADDASMAYTHLNLAILMEKQERQQDALRHAKEALTLFRRRRHQVGEALGLNAVGWSHAQLGDYHQALRCCERALTLHQQTGNRNNEAVTWDSLGYIKHHLGNVREAIACYHRALDIYDEFDSRYLGSETLIRLGDAHHARSETEAAHAAWRQALSILEDLGHSDAERVRARLLDS
jgi:DNA-binding SARP family transcriptional activator